MFASARVLEGGHFPQHATTTLDMWGYLVLEPATNFYT
jgi:hypothetical protein